MSIEDRIAILEKKVEILELEMRYPDKQFFLLLEMRKALEELLDRREKAAESSLKASELIASLRGELKELENGQL